MSRVTQSGFEPGFDPKNATQLEHEINCGMEMDAHQDTIEQAADSGLVADRKSHGRSRVSNGSKTLPETDGRLRISRRFRDIANFILVDQGGIDACSEVASS